MQSIKDQLKYQQMVNNGSFKNEQATAKPATNGGSDKPTVQDSPAKQASKKAPRKPADRVSK